MTFARGFLLATFGVALVAAAVVYWPSREPQPVPTPRPVATPTPEPFEPPEPEDDDLELPTLAKIPVCCCLNPYGECVSVRMSLPAARGHAIRHRSHDLIGRGCASVSEEEAALRRVLFRPERIEGNSAETLSMADREAYRERAGLG